MKNNSTNIIEVRRISKVFKDVGEPIVVIKELDFSVASGDFIAIRGVSGVGKSTLLHILGLLDTPTSGRVFFMEGEVTGFSDQKLSHIRNRDIGFVFQFHHLLPDFTAWENVLMPKKIKGQLRTEDIEYGKQLIDLVKMDHRLPHLPSELSGGERQRLALARALINKPKLLLADEPSGNLDEENTEMIHRLLKDVHDSLGVTIVLVTHDQELAALAEQQYVLHAGKLSPKE